MAVISRIEGLLNSQLVGQVADKSRTQPVNPPQASVRDSQVPLSPRGTDTVAHRVDTVQEVIDSQSPEKIQAWVEHLQKTMNEQSAQPHAVGFRQDPQTREVVIEIRTMEGEVIKQFPPEKILNLHRKLDELSGMVIDRMT